MEQCPVGQAEDAITTSMPISFPAFVATFNDARHGCVIDNESPALRFVQGARVDVNVNLLLSFVDAPYRGGRAVDVNQSCRFRQLLSCHLAGMSRFEVCRQARSLARQVCHLIIITKASLSTHHRY